MSGPASHSNGGTGSHDPLLAIDCQDLTFSWKEGDDPVLEDVNLKLRKGDRCLLIGANGGASTLTLSCVCC